MEEESSPSQAPPTTSPLPPSPPPSPQQVAYTTWNGLLSSSFLLQERLVYLLYTNEVALLGQVSHACRASFLTPRVLRASVHATGPSENTRFQFWKKALHVQEVQRALLVATTAGGAAGETQTHAHPHTHASLLDEAGFEVFRTVLFGRPPGREQEQHQMQQEQGGQPQQQQQQQYSGKRMLSQDGQEGEILRDIHRTFPCEPLFRDSAGVGQNLLANVLKACLIFHPDTGYCQGMNYVVASFLFACRKKLSPPSPFNSYHHQHGPPVPQTAAASSSSRSSTSRKNSIKQGYFPSISTSASSSSNPSPPPHGGGSLHNDQHHHHQQDQQQAKTDPTLQVLSPTSTIDDDEEGYHSDNSIQTQGSDSFSPPLPQRYASTTTTSSSSSFSSTTGATATHTHTSLPHPSLTCCPEKAARGKKLGYWWEASDEHTHLASEVFWMMTALMSSSSGLSMRLLWHPEVPHMKLRVFQFDRLLAQNLPRLHVHFRKIRLAPDILVTQWLMTLLAYILPLRVVVRTWDVVFLDGWKALFRISLALLQAVEDDLLPLNLEESGRFLRQWTSQRHPLWRDAERLLRAAGEWKITLTMLQALQEEFHLTLLREQLNSLCLLGGGRPHTHTHTHTPIPPVMTGEWLSRYGPPAEDAAELLKASELEGLKEEIKGIEGPLTKDFAHFRLKIEEAGGKYEEASKRVVALDGRLVDLAMQVQELEEVKAGLEGQVEGLRGGGGKSEVGGGGSGEAGRRPLSTSSSMSSSSSSSSSSSFSTSFFNILPVSRKGVSPTTSTAAAAAAAAVTGGGGSSEDGGAPPAVSSMPLPSLASSFMSRISALQRSSKQKQTATTTTKEQDTKHPPTDAAADPLRPRTSTADSSTSSSSSSSSSAASMDLPPKPPTNTHTSGNFTKKLVECLAPVSEQLAAEADKGLGATLAMLANPHAAAAASRSIAWKKGDDAKGISSSTNTTITTTEAMATTAAVAPPTIITTMLAAVTTPTTISTISTPKSAADLFLQERKLSQADAQLTSVKSLFAALQRERTEAELALEEAEAFRTSLSEQLLQLLQETEEKVNGKMREVVRNQPRHPYAAVPLALSPCEHMLESARRSHQEVVKQWQQRRVWGEEEVVGWEQDNSDGICCGDEEDELVFKTSSR